MPGVANHGCSKVLLAAKPRRPLANRCTLAPGRLLADSRQHQRRRFGFRHTGGKATLWPRQRCPVRASSPPREPRAVRRNERLFGRRAKVVRPSALDRPGFRGRLHHVACLGPPKNFAPMERARNDLSNDARRGQPRLLQSAHCDLARRPLPKRSTLAPGRLLADSCP